MQATIRRFSGLHGATNQATVACDADALLDMGFSSPRLQQQSSSSPQQPIFHHGGGSAAKKLHSRSTVGSDWPGGASVLSDEDLRLGRGLNGRTLVAASGQLQARMKEVSVGLDGDRCIGLISNAPKNVREALEYWTAQLRQVPPSSDPEEFALCHLKLGQVFHAMGLSGLEVKSVVKSVESSLHHFNLALRVYSPSNHPVRWAIAALDMGQAFGSMARLLDTEVAYEESGIETMEDDVDNTPSSEAVAKWRKDTSAKAHKATEYWQKAFDNIEQSITCLDVRSAPRTRARAFTELSKIHLRLKGTTNSAERRDLAIHALEEALSAHDAAEVSPGTHEPHDYAYHLHVGESEETDDEERDRIACGSACMQLANLCVQTHECTLGGSMESLANAIRHLERALPQLEHSKRDWCEASRLLARTQLELSHSKGPKAISKCIQALQDVLAQAPASATLLVHELNWSLGRLQLRQLQLTNAKLTTWESNQEAISIIEGRLRTAIKSLDQGNAESVTASPKILRVREVTIRRELGKLRLLSGLLAPSGDVKAVEFERASALFHSCIQQAPWGSSTMAPSEWLEGNGMIAECLCRMGRFKEAQRIYDQIADRAGALVNQLPYASVDVNPGIVVPAGVTADYPSVYESALRQHLALNWVSMWLWCQTGIECHRHSGLRSSPPTEGGEWRWISNDDTLEDPGATYATPGTPASKSKAGGNNNAAAVPLAPKGVAAPSAPAPEWVVQMQTHWALGWEWRSVEGRAVPFLLELGPPTELIGHPAALGVLRLVCRAGQLLAIEQLLTHGDSLRVRHMINKLDKETRRQLLDRRAKVRDDLMNVRKREAQGPALLLPHVKLSATSTADTQWTIRAIPSMALLSRSLEELEEFAMKEVWRQQTVAPTTAGWRLPSGEVIGSSTYPTASTLEHIIDPWEAILLWVTTAPENSANEGGSICCIAIYRERSQSAPEDTSCPAVGDAQIGDNEDGGGMNKEDAKKDKKKTKKRSILSPARKDAISKVSRPGIDKSNEKEIAFIRQRSQKRQADHTMRLLGMRQEAEKTSSTKDQASSSSTEHDGPLDANHAEYGSIRVQVFTSGSSSASQVRSAVHLWIKAVKAPDQAQRCALMSERLLDISRALRLSHILGSLPADVQELTVIQHGVMALVPFHALPLEDSSTSSLKSQVLGVCSCGDRYAVRTSSSLYALELSERTAALAARETPWYSNKACSLLDKALSFGAEELMAVEEAWSIDKEDFSVMTTEYLQPSHFTTEMQPKKKMEESNKRKSRARNKSKIEERVEETLSSSDEMAKKLGQARCLHLVLQVEHHPRPCVFLSRNGRVRRRSVNTKGQAEGEQGLPNISSPAGLADDSLPGDEEILYTEDITAQLHFRHCGLVVLSKGGYLNTINDVAEIELNAHTPPCLSLADSLMAAGAQSVLMKLWHDDELVAVDTLVLLRFYEELKGTTLDGERRPVSTALREAQLFVKNATVNDMTTALEKCGSMSNKDRERIRNGLLKLVTSIRNNGEKTDRPFANPYFWASFYVSGACGAGVHSVKSLEAEAEAHAQEEDRRQKQAAEAAARAFGSGSSESSFSSSESSSGGSDGSTSGDESEESPTYATATHGGGLTVVAKVMNFARKTFAGRGP